jgi:hypothetical protein
MSNLGFKFEWVKSTTKNLNNWSKYTTVYYLRKENETTVGPSSTLISEFRQALQMKGASKMARCHGRRNILISPPPCVRLLPNAERLLKNTIILQLSQLIAFVVPIKEHRSLTPCHVHG